MKSIKKLSLVGSVALMAATLASAEETRVLAPATPTPRPLANDYQPGESFLTKANKASGLMGMDVRNLQNQKLGDIKDLVVDLHSGRVAYAVLSVGGFLGIGEKYIAVPPSQFKLGTDGKDLILDADKVRIQTAPGFAKNNWPDLNNPTWRTHSSYWLPEGSAVGTVGSVRSGRETIGTVRDINLRTYTGRIVAIDGAARSVTVEGVSGKHQFPLSTRATISMKNEANARLENLRIGDHVTVRYHDQNGSEVVDSISDSQRLEK